MAAKDDESGRDLPHGLSGQEQTFAIVFGGTSPRGTCGAPLAIGKIAAQDMKPRAGEGFGHRSQQGRIAVGTGAVSDHKTSLSWLLRLVQPAADELAFKSRHNLKSLRIDFSFAPDGLAANASPARDFEIGKKFDERSFIFANAGETPERMTLSGAAADRPGEDGGSIAACHRYAARAITKGFEVDVQRTGSVELAKGTDAVADTGHEDSEIGAFGAL